MGDNKTLALRIADLERQLSSYKDLYESAMLSEATAKQYAEEVDKQNAALAAQVEALHSHRHDLLDLIYNCAIGQVSMGYAVDAESLAQSAYSITGIDATSNRKLTEPESPQQHLAEEKAEAGRDGFVAGYEFCLSTLPSPYRNLIAVNYKGMAERYAESIRQEVK